MSKVALLDAKCSPPGNILMCWQAKCNFRLLWKCKDGMESIRMLKDSCNHTFKVVYLNLAV